MVSLSRRKPPGSERTYTVTIPTGLYLDIQRLAEVEGRSMNKQIRQALVEMVASRQRRNHKPVPATERGLNGKLLPTPEELAAQDRWLKKNWLAADA